MAAPDWQRLANSLLVGSFVTARDDPTPVFRADDDSEARVELLARSIDSTDGMTLDNDPFEAPPAAATQPPTTEQPTRLNTPGWKQVQDSWAPPRRANQPISIPIVEDEQPMSGRALYVYPSERGTSGSEHYRDASWLAAWLASLLLVALASIYAHLLESTPPRGSVEDGEGMAMQRAMPLLAGLTLLALLAGSSAMAYVFLVQRAVRHLVFGSLVAVPVLLIIGGMWAWAGSWFEEDRTDTGDLAEDRSLLRWFSFICFIAAGLFARTVWMRRKRLERTIKVIELAATALLAHPPLLALCFALTLGFVVFTVPFLATLARFFVLAQAAEDSSWHVIWAAATAFVWLWSLGVLRGVQRVTISGVVGHCFFSRHEPDGPAPIELVKDSFTRATGPSLGSAACSALFLAFFDALTISLHATRDFLARQRSHTTRIVPPFVTPLLSVVASITAVLASSFETLSSYALVYAGITGQAFWPSATGAARLTMRTGAQRVVDCA